MHTFILFFPVKQIEIYIDIYINMESHTARACNALDYFTWD
jgi:hypothetical protein